MDDLTASCSGIGPLWEFGNVKRQMGESVHIERGQQHANDRQNRASRHLEMKDELNSLFLNQQITHHIRDFQHPGREDDAVWRSAYGQNKCKRGCQRGGNH